MAHRSDRLIRLIGVFKLVKAVLLVALGIAVFVMAHDDAVADSVYAIRPSGRFVDQLFAKVLGGPPTHLVALGIGSLIYALVYVIEGVGLVRRRRWAEYMTVIITTSFVPLEVYEMIDKGSLLKAGVIATNVAVVIYLLLRLRRENQARAILRSLRSPASSDAVRA